MRYVRKKLWLQPIEKSDTFPCTESAAKKIPNILANPEHSDRTCPEP